MKRLMKCPNGDLCDSKICPHKGLHADVGYCYTKCTNFIPWVGYCEPGPPVPQSKG